MMVMHFIAGIMIVTALAIIDVHGSRRVRIAAFCFYAFCAAIFALVIPIQQTWWDVTGKLLLAVANIVLMRDQWLKIRKA